VAQAKLQRTDTLLQYARLVAPFAGVVTARFVDPGAFIPAATSGTPAQSVAVVTLMDFSRVRAQVFVPEAEVPFITNGVPVRFRVEELPGKVFQGSVTRYARALDEATKTMLAEVELPNPDGALRPGMYASAQLEVERKHDVWLVPVAAILVEKAGTSIFIAVDGKAHKTPARIGFNDGVNAELLDGAKTGQQVILAGKLTIADGQAITVTEAK
jgi:RND family efflux transporter MFP subunit